MDLRVRAVQKRPLTGAVAREIDESDSSDSEPPREDSQDDVWLPTPAASGAGSGDGESSEAFSVSDVTDLTSSTSEGGPPTRVVALPPNTVEFASWEAFDEYLAAYEAQTFQVCEIHSRFNERMSDPAVPLILCYLSCRYSGRALIPAWQSAMPGLTSHSQKQLKYQHRGNSIRGRSFVRTQGSTSL